MAELMAMMGTAAGGTAAAAPAAAAGAGGIAGGTAGLFGSAGAAAPSAMTASLMGPAAATPFVTGMDSAAMAKFLSPETFGLGAPPAAGSSMPWASMAGAAQQMMQNDSSPSAGSMGSRPPGYNPNEPMEQQFARIMGWLKQNGGRV